jgi:hypothetical protein
LEVGEGSEGAGFVSQGSSAVEDGLHLVRVDGVSGIEGNRIVEERNDVIGRRVAGRILGQCIGLGQGSAAIEGGEGAVDGVEPVRWLRRPIRPLYPSSGLARLKGIEAGKESQPATWSRIERVR